METKTTTVPPVPSLTVLTRLYMNACALEIEAAKDRNNYSRTLFDHYAPAKLNQQVRVPNNGSTYAGKTGYVTHLNLVRTGIGPMCEVVIRLNDDSLSATNFILPFIDPMARHTFVPEDFDCIWLMIVSMECPTSEPIEVTAEYIYLACIDPSEGAYRLLNIGQNRLSPLGYTVEQACESLNDTAQGYRRATQDEMANIMGYVGTNPRHLRSEPTI